MNFDDVIKSERSSRSQGFAVPPLSRGWKPKDLIFRRAWPKNIVSLCLIREYKGVCRSIQEYAGVCRSIRSIQEEYAGVYEV